MYFDTDARSLAGLSHHDFVKKFTELVCRALLHGIGSVYSHLFPDFAREVHA